MASVVLAGNTYDSSQFAGYGYQQQLYGDTLFPNSIFRDMLLQLSTSTAIQGLLATTAGDVPVANGTNWVLSHSYTGTAKFGGAIQVTSGSTIVGTFIGGADAEINLYAPTGAGGIDHRRWGLDNDGTNFNIRRLNDAYSIGTVYFSIKDSGAVVVGADPGGSNLLRVGGGITASSVNLGSASANQTIITQAANGNYHWLMHNAGGGSPVGLYLSNAGSDLSFSVGGNVFTMTGAGALTLPGAITATTVIGSTSVAATRTTGGVTVSHVGDQNTTTFNVVNSKTCTASVGQGQMIFSVYFGGTGMSCLFAASYDTTTITALSPLPTEILLSSAPGASQLGIFKSANTFTVSFKSGSALAATSGVMAISFLGNSVVNVTDWA